MENKVIDICDFDILESKGGLGKVEAKAWYRNGTITSDPPKELTERDYQAMWNFDGYASTEAIAENFNCSVDYVLEIINTRPWLRTKPSENKAVNLTWWESDHSDSSELAKLFYPEIHEKYFPKEDISQVMVKEKSGMTWREYYESVDWENVWDNGQGAIDAIYEEVKRCAALEGVNLSFI